MHLMINNVSGPDISSLPVTNRADKLASICIFESRTISKKPRSPSDAALTWRKIRSEHGEDLRILQVRHDWLEHPTSMAVMKRLVLESVDWINIVALTRDQESVMVRQYRFGIEACTLETPGGMVDEGETPLEAAQRELLEETGYESDEWSYLGAVEPNPAFHPHLCHHFLARNVKRVAELDLGPGEAIEIEICDLERLRAAIHDGSLRHSLALSALTRVFPLWRLPRTQSFVTVTRP